MPPSSEASIQSEIQREIASFLASLYFMNKEARYLGLSRLEDVFVEAINAIELWLNEPEKKNEDIQEIVSLDLFKAMQFLEGFSRLTNKDSAALLDALEHFDAIRKKAS